MIRESDLSFLNGMYELTTMGHFLSSLPLLRNPVLYFLSLDSVTSMSLQYFTFLYRESAVLCWKEDGGATEDNYPQGPVGPVTRSVTLAWLSGVSNPFREVSP